MKGRPKPLWKGNYELIDSSTQVASSEVNYYIAVTEEKSDENELTKEFYSMIPFSWFAADMNCFLYPPEEVKVAGLGPMNWQAKSFARHFRPKSSWTEYDVASLPLNKKTSKFLITIVTSNLEYC